MSDERGLVRRLGEPLAFISSVLSIIQVVSSNATLSLAGKILSFFFHFAVYLGVGSLIAASIWLAFDGPSRPWLGWLSIAFATLGVVLLLVLSPNYYAKLDSGKKVFAGVVGIVAFALIVRSAVTHIQAFRKRPPAGTAS